MSNLELKDQKEPAISPCSALSVDLNNAGRFMGIKNAKDSLSSYLGLQGTPPRNEPDHIYGHVFGLNRLIQLLDSINNYNASTEGLANPIAAVKIYYGNCKRSDPKFPMREPDKLYRDLFFMPVKADGNDFYKDVNPLDESALTAPGILGESRPCPNECGTPFLETV